MARAARGGSDVSSLPAESTDEAMGRSWSLQRLLVADAEPTAFVFAERRPAAVSARLVERQRFGLADTGSESHGRVAQRAPSRLKHFQHPASSAEAPGLRQNEHPLDLADTGLELAQRAAADRSVAAVRDDNYEQVLRGRWRVVAEPRIAVFEFRIEGRDEDGEVGRIAFRDANNEVRTRSQRCSPDSVRRSFSASAMERATSFMLKPYAIRWMRLFGEWPQTMKVDLHVEQYLTANPALSS